MLSIDGCIIVWKRVIVRCVIVMRYRSTRYPSTRYRLTRYRSMRYRSTRYRSTRYRSTRYRSMHYRSMHYRSTRYRSTRCGLKTPYRLKTRTFRCVFMTCLRRYAPKTHRVQRFARVELFKTHRFENTSLVDSTLYIIDTKNVGLQACYFVEVINRYSKRLAVLFQGFEKSNTTVLKKRIITALQRQTAML